MADIIKQLPDSVANQIAAGEVIQRPASAVKELLENAVDAGADKIHLLIKDAGKMLIQVIDNGCGMSSNDARSCFGRHATSKISSAQDLFRIRTMGFRGEAMASIASIAQVEMKTRTKESDTGTLLKIEGSEVKEETKVACQAGTNIMVKNLFFNVPARRNFLKSNASESRHILEEFSRVALAFPDLSFEYTENGKTRFQLPPGSIKDRIARLFGKHLKEGLVEVNSETSLLKVYGFVGKPDIARKTRGEQFFLVNHRYIRHPYLHHAVDNAFEGLLPEGSFPSYFIFLDIDPERIDINIHPTKAEVNFQDAKIIYNLLRSAVREAIGRYSIRPSLDFDQEQSMDVPYDQLKTTPAPPSVRIDPDYNPFSPKQERNRDWEKAFPPAGEESVQQHSQASFDQEELSTHGDIESKEEKLLQLNRVYIVTPVKSGLMIIDHNRAHKRILYEHFLRILESGKGLTQQQLFPQTLKLNPSDSSLMDELKDDFKLLGFDINPFGDNTFIINGIPSGWSSDNPAATVEEIIEQFKKNFSDPKANKQTKLASGMASRMAIPAGRKLSEEEMRHIVNELFSCELPESCPAGKPTLHIIPSEKIAGFFD